MTRDEFDALVKRLEAEAKKHPKYFLINTVALVVGAYSYLLIILLFSLAMCAACLALILYKPHYGTIKIGLILIVLFGGMFIAIVKGLWVRMDEPDGLELTRQNAPELIAMLDDLRGKLDCAPFHKVILVGNNNAAVTQIPRLGIFGWHKNILLIGLPLIMSMPPEEFRAVLAHEFAHSSRGHGRFGNWLYRLRQSWGRVVVEMARQQNKGIKLMTVFLSFFWPKFSGRSFVLSRANEYEADACAVRLTSAPAIATALMRLQVCDRLLDEDFWPAFYQRAITEAEAPNDLYARMSASLAEGAPLEKKQKWLQQAFLAETNSANTHPSLTDRLAAIGFNGNREDVPGFQKSAAEVYLGSNLPGFIEQLTTTWRTAVETAWKERHAEAAKAEQELAGLNPNAEGETVESVWKMALKMIDLRGDAAAMPFIERVLALDPTHQQALFIRGRHCLNNDDPQGEEMIERVMASDPFATEAGLHLIHAFCARNGHKDRLRQIENQLDAFEDLRERALHERNNVTVADDFFPAELTEAQLAGITKIFEKEHDVSAVAVVRKKAEIFPHLPIYVISVRTREKQAQPANQALVNRSLAQVDLPGHFLMFVDAGELKPLAKRVFAVEGATAYAASQ